MSPEFLLIIYAIAYWAGVSFAYWAGWRARDRQRPLPAAEVRSYGLPPGYRSIDYPDPSPDRRGNRSGGPTTPKPQFPPGRVTDVHGTTIGYRRIPPSRNP